MSTSKLLIFFPPKISPPLLFLINANSVIVFFSLLRIHQLSSPHKPALYSLTAMLGQIYSSHSSLLIGLLAFTILPPNHLSHLSWTRLPKAEYIIQLSHAILWCWFLQLAANLLKSDV